MRRFLCWLGFHGPRDQGEVGYCPHCGDFLGHATNGRIWTHYVAPQGADFDVLDHVGGLPPRPPDPTPGVGDIGRPAPVEVHVYHHHD